MIPGLPPHERDDRGRYGGWVDLALQMALTLAGSVLLLGLGGKWLDGMLGTYPLFLIIGALWGAIGGTVWVVIRVKRYGDEQERREKNGQGGNT